MKTNADTVVVFSGGTDSTCAAALAASEHKRVHLLTYFEHSTEGRMQPLRNVEKLRKRFPETEFITHFETVDPLVRHFSYDRYFHYLLRHRALVLATPGFSSLSWHLRTILYCRKNSIDTVSDGLTKELMHFPGHMTEVIALFRELYARYGIQYSNPVREWEVPEDRQFIDQVIVNTHGGDFLLEEDNTLLKTTGRRLHELGIMPSPNVKGTKLDRLMQQDCYPFAIYNILAFWCYLAFEPYPVFCARVEELFREKCADAAALLDDHFSNPDSSRLSQLLGKAVSS